MANKLFWSVGSSRRMDHRSCRDRLLSRTLGNKSVQNRFGNGKRRCDDGPEFFASIAEDRGQFNETLRPGFAQLAGHFVPLQLVPFVQLAFGLDIESAIDAEDVLQSG